MKIFSGIVAGQYLLFQYGTYVAYSWDIIEPIACVTGFIDAFFAALFLARHKLNWDVAGIGSYYNQKIFRKLIKKEKKELELERYYELKDAIAKVE